MPVTECAYIHISKVLQSYAFSCRHVSQAVATWCQQLCCVCTEMVVCTCVYTCASHCAYYSQVLREPRSSSNVDAVLEEYASHIKENYPREHGNDLLLTQSQSLPLSLSLSLCRGSRGVWSIVHRVWCVRTVMFQRAHSSLV
jgi:hypothetical protein